MKPDFRVLTLWLLTAAFFVVTPAAAQKKETPKNGGQTRSIVFAVHDGKWIEPIGIIGATGEFGDESEEPEDMKVFATTYYKPKAVYPLIFGGSKAGTVTVVKSRIGTECGGSSADATVASSTAKLSAMVMGLATNVKLPGDGTSYRRRPTPVERTAVERLVRAEFNKNGASTAAVKNLRYHNLTGVDIDNDDMPEFIGSYWIAPTAKERRLLFFIAERKGDSDLELSHSEHSVIGEEDMMSGDLKDLEAGLGAELLIDLLDYNRDGVREIFTIGRAFEGNNYYVYKRDGAKWTKVHENYVYRCAF